MRLRVVNEDRHSLMTGNRRLDQHIAELVTKLLSDHPKIQDELQDLLKMLQVLTRLLATYAQEAIYKGESDVPESEFQSTVLRDLRSQLGQDVQEHPNQAGGVTDIRYRGVVVELKVEKENGDREYISRKYTAQAAQYAGVEARQVSILLVLDLTTKDKPPGDIRNDIILTDVETHGGDDRAKRVSIQNICLCDQWEYEKSINLLPIIAHFTTEKFGSLMIPVPTFVLLDEYRTRLIADVVTGKVDVREAAAELSAV